MKLLCKFSALFIAGILLCCSQNNVIRPLPDVDHKDLSNLHGFNLLEKFTADWSCSPYLEKDFSMISGYGFNFIRLPIDYRCITVQGQWGTLDDAAMKDIDTAIEWGKKYGIHVCINLHHAPGYCINNRELYPPDSSLWTSKAAQDAFVSLWRQMAKRYKGISNDNVSFNLLNEPEGTSKEAYLKVAVSSIEAIREVDPGRLIMSDGWKVGREPIEELVPYDVVQMFRGYWPMNISHYGADWIDNVYGPVPEWPSNQYLSQYIHGPDDNTAAVPFILRHRFEKETPVKMEVLIVSGDCRLEARAANRLLISQYFNPENDDFAEHHFDSYKNRWTGACVDTLELDVPAGTDSLSISLAEGGYITFGRVAVFLEGEDRPPVNIIPGNIYDSPQVPVEIRGNTFVTVNDPDADWIEKYRTEQLEPWIKFKEKNNIGIMVGEWGVYEKAPYDVTMAWMKDMLTAWGENNLGWAMWNFRGSFGVADNNRSSAEFDDVDGVKMDIKMLRLLQEAIK